jgi:hypothetical protein
MSAEPIGTALHKRAKNSRRVRVYSAGVRRDRRRSWIRPLRRMLRAIEVTQRLLESSCRVINACRTAAEEHPIRSTRQLEKVAGWLVEASEQLGRGADGLKTTGYQLERFPADGAGAPSRIIMATGEWIQTATMLAEVSNRLDERIAFLEGYVNDASAPLDLEELFPRAVPAPRRICFVVRRPSLKFLSRENNRVFCIHIRRQRPGRLTVAEAPRRIFRGRAPPSVSTCSL